MKRLLEVLITILLAGSAFAVIDEPDIQFTVLSGGQDEISVNTSDTYYIDIAVSALPNGDATMLINTGELLITIDGNAEFTGNTDFTYWNWWGMGVGTNMHQYLDSKTLRICAGYVGITEMFMMPLPDLVNGNLAIDHIGVHQTGIGDAFITVIPASVLKPWGNVCYLGTNDLPGFDMEAIGGQLIVYKIPEPGTVLLLGLGAVLLRRKRC